MSWGASLSPAAACFGSSLVFSSAISLVVPKQVLTPGAFPCEPKEAAQQSCSFVKPAPDPVYTWSKESLMRGSPAVLMQFGPLIPPSIASCLALAQACCDAQ